MHWGETNLFLHLELTGTTPLSRSATTLEMSSREFQAYNKSNNHKEDTKICYRSSTSHLEVYISVEEPTKSGPLHLGHFPPSSDHKDRSGFTYSISG
jgi:hypothetical protein